MKIPLRKKSRKICMKPYHAHYCLRVIYFVLHRLCRVHTLTSLLTFLSFQLSHLTRANFRASSPIVARRSSFGDGSRSLDHKKPFKNFHEHDPRCKPTEFSEHNRKFCANEDILAGGSEISVEGDVDRVGRRVRANIPGSGHFRYYYPDDGGADKVPSRITQRARPAQSFKDALRVTANLDGHELRYTLPSDRHPTKVGQEQHLQNRVKRTDANNNHDFMRYHEPGFSVGKRHLRHFANEQTFHAVGSAGEESLASTSEATTSLAGRRRHKMTATSSLWTSPSYPTTSKADDKIAVSPGKISGAELEIRKAESRRVPRAGLACRFFDESGT